MVGWADRPNRLILCSLDVGTIHRELAVFILDDGAFHFFPGAHASRSASRFFAAIHRFPVRVRVVPSDETRFHVQHHVVHRLNRLRGLPRARENPRARASSHPTWIPCRRHRSHHRRAHHRRRHHRAAFERSKWSIARVRARCGPRSSVFVCRRVDSFTARRSRDLRKIRPTVVVLSRDWSDPRSSPQRRAQRSESTHIESRGASRRRDLASRRRPTRGSAVTRRAIAPVDARRRRVRRISRPTVSGFESIRPVVGRRARDAKGAISIVS